METMTQPNETDAIRQAEIRGMSRTLAISTLIAVLTLSAVLLSYVF